MLRKLHLKIFPVIFTLNQILERQAISEFNILCTAQNKKGSMYYRIEICGQLSDNMSVFFPRFVLCVSHSRIQTEKLFDTKQTIYFTSLYIFSEFLCFFLSSVPNIIGSNTFTSRFNVKQCPRCVVQCPRCVA